VSECFGAINWAALTAYMDQNPNATVLYNGWWPEWAMEWYPGPHLIRGALIPETHLIEKHLETHPAIDMGANLQKLKNEISENIRFLEDMMEILKKPIYTGESVDELFGAEEYEMEIGKETETDELS
jgi:hypothetical protein